jgi:hypothetical protein
MFLSLALIKIYRQKKPAFAGFYPKTLILEASLLRVYKIKLKK